ncbi:hypothetical protein [Vibrio hepatarius]|uniref:hypothetical protein n=1 Tax=Vibrio hepatarius TaxID=171383 RepID=UPI001C08B0AF|nr:hypothetical protein [Vibrio hepatarius]MBU2899318.1 hypothetical protein [Vibrio hepatarius]
MKFNKLSVLIGVALLPSWSAVADTIEQTLIFTPDNCDPGWYCQYKSNPSEQGGLDTSQLSSYKMAFKSLPQVPGVNVGESVWSNGAFVIAGGNAAGQEVQQWPEFSADVTFDGAPSGGGDGGTEGGTDVLPTENAVIHHVTFPYDDAQTTIDVFNLNTPYATDVVISNLIAGTLYSYLVEKKYPEVHFNKEYLVGSILSQLLQEAGLSDSRINPDYSAEAEKQAIHEPGYASQLLAVGQGGPYQINDYSKRLPDASTPGSLGLINYDALYQGLGYTIDDQDSSAQSERVGPDSLDDMYFGPIAATYFQFNDINRLEVLAGQSWYQSQEAWNTCFNTALKDEGFTSDPNALRLTDFLINVIYNAGDYSPVFQSYLDVCVSAYGDGTNFDFTSELPYLNDYDLDPQGYQEVISDNNQYTEGDSTYFRYPRQVSFYADQLFGKDLSASGLNMTNTQILTVADLEPVFVKVFAQLSYKTQQEQLPKLIDEGTAELAFQQAIENAGVTLDTSYSLSVESQRNALFDFLYQAFVQLESSTADLGAVSGEITGDDNGNGGTTPPVDGEEWNPSTEYSVECTVVTYKGQEYQNQWWTKGDEPNPAEGDTYNTVWRFPSAASNDCP